MAATTDTPMRYESSAGELSSPPSGPLSEPGSPSRRSGATRAKNTDTDDKHQSAPVYDQVRTVESANGGPPKRYALVDGEWVQLTVNGVPRKKPGRKPGAAAKTNPEGSDSPHHSDHAKVRKPRKPRDPNAPPIQRKRKIAPAGSEDGPDVSRALSFGMPSTNAPRSPQPMAAPPYPHSQPQSDQRYSPNLVKREPFLPGSMQSILNADLPSQSQRSNTSTPIPVRSSGQTYDPIRDGKYDPVRETMMTSHNSYSPNSGSPRAPAQAPNRSPSIASLIEPRATPLRSPSQSQNGYQPGLAASRFQAKDTPTPSSPPSTTRPTPASAPSLHPAAQEARKDQPPPPPPIQRPVIKESNFTTIANGPVKKVSPKQKPNTGVSTPKTDYLDDGPQEGEGRSILDFGRARPGEETQAPTIVLKIAIQPGETNKYVNFMRLAEERYGWDALHPRMAADRDRKARIAAAAASLEKVESGRESGDEMSVDLSDAEGSNPENGGASGVDNQAKPKKKRNFKEDQYDVDDDFVDDSELLWEAQAAASRDGFFVYSGPLVPEVEKPPAGYVTLLRIPYVTANSVLTETQTRWSSQTWAWWQRLSRWTGWFHSGCLRHRPRWRSRLSRRFYHEETANHKIGKGSARARKGREREIG